MKRLVALLLVAPMLLLGEAALAKNSTKNSVKVPICHRTSGKKAKLKIINVSGKAPAGHLAHGDNVVGLETCNGIDDDCDGTVDDGDVCAPDPCAGLPDGQTCDAGMDGVVLTCEGGVCDTCVPAGTCSLTTATCAFDEDCPGVETCVLAPTPAIAWAVGFDTGDVSTGTKSISLFVRGVRGGS